MSPAAQARNGTLSFLLSLCFAVSRFLGSTEWLVSPLPALIWAVGAAWRWYLADRKVVMDCFLFGLVNLWIAGDVLSLLSLWIRNYSGYWPGWWYVVSRLLVPLGFVALLPQSRSSTTTQKQTEDLADWTVPYPKARIFSCQTKHARIFPKRHAFEYSYLQCGFPIVPAGVASNGSDVTNFKDVQLGSWWMSIRAGDYLTRGQGALGFYEKLRRYLREQHVENSEWSYAYLITAPRFFGYSFNPVSFWYIYDADNQLTKMILEVNNTFGERRMYLLDGSGVPTPAQMPESEVSGPETTTETNPRFTDIWMKDFHVSPFNSRKGSYAVKVRNPFPSPHHEDPMIDNTITLLSSKNYAKVVARLNSVDHSLDPEKMGLLGKLQFISSWWWVGFMTFPRIVKEAGKLFFKRKLNVFFRPEVVSTSAGRLPTSEEIELYEIFKDYLTDLINISEHAFSIRFYPGIPDQPSEIQITKQDPDGDQTCYELEIRVLTPAFYSRFVHYAYTSEAFDRECIFTDEKNRTAWVSRPQLLPLLVGRSSTGSHNKNSVAGRGLLDELRWSALRRLRCAPATPPYPATVPSTANCAREDIRSLPYSQLDRFVRSTKSHSYAGVYRRLVTKMFLGRRFAFGFTELIGLIDLMLRIFLCYLGASRLMSLTHTKLYLDSLTCNAYKACNESITKDKLDETGPGQWWRVAQLVATVSACHVYSLIKGPR